MSKAALCKPAPDFEAQAIVDMDFKKFRLSDFKGKYIELFFYPLDLTFVCPTEIIAFSDRSDEFRAIGCEVSQRLFFSMPWLCFVPNSPLFT